MIKGIAFRKSTNCIALFVFGSFGNLSLAKATCNKSKSALNTLLRTIAVDVTIE